MTSKRAYRSVWTASRSRLYKVTTAAAVAAPSRAWPPQAVSLAVAARRFLPPSAVRLISVGYAY